MKNKIILYGIPNCNSMAKARDYLKANNIEYTEINLKKEAFSEREIEHILKIVPLTKLVNTKGPTYRNWSKASGHDITKIAIDDAISAIVANQSMIKRPCIKAGDKYYIGLDEMEQVR